MPYLKFPTFKFGRNPSLRDAYDLSNLTGTQKLTMTASRIFGFRIGGNLRGGNKILRNKLMGAKRLSMFTFSFIIIIQSTIKKINIYI